LTRVRFLGDINDFAPLLMAVDICLASFPNSDTSSVIEAMGVGKPVVVMKVPPSAQSNSGAELVGLRELTAPGQADYVEIADQLLRNPAKRKTQGEAVVERFRSNFRPEQLGQRYVDFINRLAQSKKIEVDRAAE
jgi:glycosyltransferase involved in cell wall biosynthesis